MSKGLFWALFLFACATAALGMKPTVSVPAPDEEQQIDQMFDLTNRLRAERRIPILGLDARLCHAATGRVYVTHGTYGFRPIALSPVRPIALSLASLPLIQASI